MTKRRSLIQSVLHRFYNVHHDSAMFENELIDELKAARVRAFSETKHKTIQILDFRIDMLTKSIEVHRKDGELSEVLEDMKNRRDELQSFRSYVKGMLVKVDE